MAKNHPHEPNWTDAACPMWPVAPWDTPGLPARTMRQRCAHHHGLCAYRDDDPNRCPRCHVSLEKANSEGWQCIVESRRTRTCPLGKQPTKGTPA